MYVTTEYFTVGHDVVTSLFEKGIFEMFSPEATSVNLFLGGIGDARNVLQTICVLASL